MATMHQSISAVMIVKNGAATLAKALDSLRAFEDVVVYDNGSTDNTKTIATRYANVRFFEGTFIGFGQTKNTAAALAKHDWVLIIDSDEAIEPGLAAAMHEQRLDPQTVYLLNRKAFYKNQQVRYCGWGNEKIHRLYHRGHTQLTPADVHEDIVVAGLRVRELSGGSLLHYSYGSVSDFIVKLDRYSSLYAQHKQGRKPSSPLKAAVNAAYSFFRTYVLKRGFLDGYVGLLIAFSHMATNFYKYIKLYEANMELPLTQLLITRHDKIGDFVLALPLCQAVKQAMPGCEITVLVHSVNSSLAKAMPFIDHVIIADQPFFSLVNALRQKKFTTSISCFIDSRLGAALWLAGISKRWAPATKLAQIFFNARLTQRRSQVTKTEWQYNLDLGRAAFPGFDLSWQPPLLTPAILEERFSDQVHANLKPAQGRRVVFHPGFGGSSDGNLSPQDYVRLARTAQLKNVEVVFSFGPNDTASKQAITPLIDFPALILDSPMSLPAFCNYLSRCDLLVSTSTGPMHLAAAANVPTLSFFGNSLFASSSRWAPINDPARQHHVMLPTPYAEEHIAKAEALLVKLLA